MPNKDGTGNALDGLRNIGIAALSFAPMVIAGLKEAPLWIMSLAGALGGAILAKFVTKGSWKNIGGWAAIGAIAGALFYITV